jgi:two-component system cell cycle response regulator
MFHGQLWKRRIPPGNACFFRKGRKPGAPETGAKVVNRINALHVFLGIGVKRGPVYADLYYMFKYFNDRMLKGIAAELNVPPESMQGRLADFEDLQLASSVSFIRVFILLVGAFNLALLLPDIRFVSSFYAVLTIVILRVSFVIAVLVLFFRIRMVKTFNSLSAVVTVIELFAGAIFIFVMSQYSPPDFMIQLVGMVIIVIAVFLVPNKWMRMLGISLAVSAGYLVFSYIYIPDIDANDFAAGVIYLGVAILLCGTFAYHSQRHQFGEFIAKEELRRSNATDHLTKLANRSKLIEEAARWMDFSKRHAMPLSLIIVDIDNLKKINDTYGHLTGDAVISGLAGLMQGMLRQEDVMARWGGDEFIILLPHTRVDEAQVTSERLRTSVAAYTCPEELTATCSFGIAGMKKDSTLESLIASADKSLYRAKRHGKNSVQVRE